MLSLIRVKGCSIATPDMSVVFRISKVILILIIVSFGTLTTDQAGVPQRRQDHSRTCINYGHACWGAHGKRGGDKNMLFQKLVSSMLRDSAEPQLLKYYPKMKQPLYSTQWIPYVNNFYERRNKNGDRSYDEKKNEIRKIIKSSNNRDENNELPLYNRETRFTLRNSLQKPLQKTSQGEEDISDFNDK